jgi:hypothetical protein
MSNLTKRGVYRSFTTKAEYYYLTISGKVYSLDDKFYNPKPPVLVKELPFDAVFVENPHLCMNEEYIDKIKFDDAFELFDESFFDLGEKLNAI